MDSKKKLLNRIKRIEGQLKAIKRMVEEESHSCSDVLTQVSAAKSAINKVGIIILENHTKDCISNSLNSSNEEEIDKMIKTITTFLK